MSEPVELKQFPAYRQAVRDFLGEFQPGDLVPRGWLEEHFDLDQLAAGALLTMDDVRERQWKWLAAIEGFKSDLLAEHQVYLQSVRGEGYRWVPPAEQTGLATREFQRDARKAFRSVGQRLKNIRADLLTDDQRRENMDAIAKVTALRGMTRKALR